MDTVLSYRGRSVSHSDVAFIGELIATHPQASRRAISRELCQQWQWLQPNGTPRDMVCRGLLLALHRQGHIALPQARYVKKDAWFRRRPESIDVCSEPLVASLKELGPVHFTQTFVDPQRYKGTCYKAANWTYLGMTAGRGNNAPTMAVRTSQKDLYVYPLVKDFRRQLGS